MPVEPKTVAASAAAIAFEAEQHLHPPPVEIKGELEDG
jgi:hypothetical protein